MSAALNTSGALSGLQVLDLTGRMGGYCGLLLANLGAELILSIHDEVLVLCHAHQAEEVAKIVTEAMQSAYQEAFGAPLKVPILFEMNPVQNWSQKD